MGDIEGIYHPPGFYVALMQDVLGIGVGMGTGIALPFLIPEAAGTGVVSLSALGTASGRAGIGAAVGSTVNHLMPGGSWDAGRKNTLWPRYEADFKRRGLK